MTSTTANRSESPFMNEQANYPAFSFFFRIHSGSEKQLHDAGHIRGRCHEYIKASLLKPTVIEALLTKTDALIDNLNFHCGAKSVALFVSPDSSHSSLFYIDIPEKMYLGEYFSSYERLFAEQESAPYLMFVFEPTTVKVYKGQGLQLETLTETNSMASLHTVYKHRAPLKASKNGKTSQSHEFDPKWKNELIHEIAKVCTEEKLPCYVAGLNAFGAEESELLSNGVELLVSMSVVQQPGDSDELKSLAEDLIARYQTKKAETLLSKCENAMGVHRLATGVDEIVNCAKDGRAAVLVLEAPAWSTEAEGKYGTLHEAVRQTILKHGEVEFVREGTLSKWNGAALILRY